MRWKCAALFCLAVGVAFALESGLRRTQLAQEQGDEWLSCFLSKIDLGFCKAISLSFSAMRLRWWPFAAWGTLFGNLFPGTTRSDPVKRRPGVTSSPYNTTSSSKKSAKIENRADFSIFWPHALRGGAKRGPKQNFRVYFSILYRSVYSDLDNSSSRRSNLRLSRFWVCTCFFQDFEKMIRKSRSLLIKTEVYLLFIEKNRGNLIWYNLPPIFVIFIFQIFGSQIFKKYGSQILDFGRSSVVWPIFRVAYVKVHEILLLSCRGRKSPACLHHVVKSVQRSALSHFRWC